MPTALSPTSRAVLWAAGSALAFAAGSAAAKFLGQKLPPAELAFVRAAFGVLFLIGAWRVVMDIRAVKEPGWYALRCGLGIIAAYGIMYAFTSGAPLGLVSLIFFSRVLLLPMTARLLLGERSGLAVWGAVGIGFLGAAVSIWPALAMPEMRLGIVAALVAAVASAGSQTAVRRLSLSNPPGLIVLIYSASVVLAFAPAAAVQWVTPPAADWPVLAALGLFGVLAQYTAARAFRQATVGFLAPLDFLTVPFAALLGYGLFNEVPSAWTVAGSVMVVTGTAIISSIKNQD